MLRIRLVFFVTSFMQFGVIGKEERIVEQIYRGEPSSKEQFPFLVRIYIVLDKVLPLCTGSIITHNLILTAGHCCAEPGQKYVVMGEVDQERFYREANKNLNLNVTGYWAYKVELEHIHPEYTTLRYTVMHDVCVLELEKAMDSEADNHTVIPVSYRDIFYRRCTAVGWGQTENNKMQFKMYHKTVFAESSWRGNWLIRLYFHTICSGDSGGPLICQGKVFGVASFSTTFQCNRRGIDYYAYLREEQNFLKRFVSRAPSRLKFFKPKEMTDSCHTYKRLVSV